MKIVIDIPDEQYKRICDHTDGVYDMISLLTIIENGIPLPKGHGRLIDADKVIKKMEEREEQLKDDRSIWESAAVETALDMFGETIIEADKESD